MGHGEGEGSDEFSRVTADDGGAEDLGGAFSHVDFDEAVSLVVEEGAVEVREVLFKCFASDAL